MGNLRLRDSRGKHVVGVSVLTCFVLAIAFIAAYAHVFDCLRCDPDMLISRCSGSHVFCETLGQEAIEVHPANLVWPEHPLHYNTCPPTCTPKWIGLNDGGTLLIQGAPQDEAHFSDVFVIPEGFPCATACIEITADDMATVTMNGNLVGVHKDSDGNPSGGPSGWDEVSTFEIDPSFLMLGGPNTLEIKVEDTGGVRMGAIWCVRICLYAECCCASQPMLKVIDEAGFETLIPPDGTGYAMPGSLVPILEGCSHPDCPIEGTWRAEVREFTGQQFEWFQVAQGPVELDGFLGDIVMDTGCLTFYTSYSCEEENCVSDPFWFRVCPCLCGRWEDLFVVGASDEYPVYVNGQPQFSQYPAYVSFNLPEQTADVLVVGSYLCSMCETAAQPAQEYSYTVLNMFTSQFVLSGTATGIPLELPLPYFDDDGNGKRDGFVLYLQPTCELSCPVLRIQISFY